MAPATQLALILILCFVASVLVAQTVSGFAFSARERSARVNRRLTLLAAGLSRDQVYEVLIKRRQPMRADGTRKTALLSMATRLCQQAGVDAAPIHLVSVAAITALALWLASLGLLRGRWTGMLLPSACIALVGALLLSFGGLWVWLSRRRNKRLLKLEEQLPGALDIMVRALRVGHPTVAAIQLVADELGDPVGSEFGFVVDETTYGIEFPEAVANLAARSGSKDAAFLSVGIAIQSETGGNLAEIFEQLSTVIRSRATLAKRVRALSSEGRMSALMLSALPLFLVGLLSLTEPQFYVSKFNDPIFWPTTAAVGCLYLIGWFIIRRIIDIKY
ncbi:MAG: secretion system protein [Caulobacteraceae bacterium]|nr:secretion system protein [Caulobacteraceae bacterium]